MAICLLATLADPDSDSDPDPDSDSPVIESIHVVKKGGFKFQLVTRRTTYTCTGTGLGRRLGV